MRDPKRVARMLEKLQIFWEAHPDLRLGQLMDNAVSLGLEGAGGIDIFYVEDDIVETGLDKLIRAMPTRKISVNGREIEVREESLSYETIVRIANGSPQVLYSVTYSGGAGPKPQGILSPGQSVIIRDGMIFNSCFTGNA